ncbi:hypothetical protein L6452_18343 [Arctium lappa]|uniref:Uncharacterized protein n=1 Tax=Arctium lappa TaxID=4217 RepID=A0ACB9C659_ARCLA|nr:hypothetical protein L6452_18343 [Arctium lappa]
MATQSRILVILLGFLFCFLHHDVATALQGTQSDSNLQPTDPYNQRLDGDDITQLDPNSPQVVAAAKFAVDKHNQDTKQHLTFVKVVRAESKPMAGITYNLIFDAKDGSQVNLYHAFVVVNSLGIKSLFSFDGPYH